MYQKYMRVIKACQGTLAINHSHVCKCYDLLHESFIHFNFVFTLSFFSSWMQNRFYAYFLIWCRFFLEAYDVIFSSDEPLKPRQLSKLLFSHESTSAGIEHQLFGLANLGSSSVFIPHISTSISVLPTLHQSRSLH